MSKKKSSNSKNKSSAFSVKVVETSTTLVEKAGTPYQDVVRLTGQDKKHLPKLKRGARDVISTIATLASKHGIVLSGASLDDMVSQLESARNLDPLLIVVGTLYETLRDSQLSDEAAAWKTATAAYGVLQSTAKVNKTLASELQPVKSWFRNVVRRRSTDTAATTAPSTDAPAAPATNKVVTPQ